MKKTTPTIKLTPGNVKPKGRRSAPKAEGRKTGKKELYAYVFRDPRVGSLHVLNSSNAWWLDVTKLQRLVDAYCFYYKDEEACSYAGITIGNLKYFQQMHPDFYTIKHTAKAQPSMHSKKAIIRMVQTDPTWAAWWLERVEKDTFSTRQEQSGPNGRDLLDGLTEEIKQMGEALRYNESDEKAEKHIDNTGAGNANAGPDGPGDEAAAGADNGPEAASVSS